jgi:hypothetical protein
VLLPVPSPRLPSFLLAVSTRLASFLLGSLMSTASPRPSQAVPSPGPGTPVHHTTLSPINTPPPRGTRGLQSSRSSTTFLSISLLKPAQSGLVERDTVTAVHQRPPAPATLATTATATNLLLAAHHPALLLLLLPVVLVAVTKTTLPSSSSPATTKSVSWWAVNLFSSMPTPP